MTMKNSKIYELDYVRVACTLGVFLYHFSCENATTIPGTFITVNSNMGVIYNCCFFMLSGYLIDRRYSNDIDYKQYYISKFKSIFPLYWIAWCTCLIWKYLTSPNLFSYVPAYRLIYTFLGIDGMLFARINAFYIVGEWFTGIIILCYIIYPFINKAIRNNKGLFLTLVAFFLLSVVQRKYNTFNITVLYQSFIVSFLEFLIGILMYRTRKYWDNRYIFWVCFVIFEILIFYPIKYYLYIFSYIHSICFFIIVFNIGKSLKQYNTINNAVSFFSKYSYGFFLLHHVALLIAISVASPRRIMANIIVCLITFVVCLTLAYLITEIKNKLLVLSKSKTIRICIISLFSIIVLFCVVNFLFPKNTKISEGEQSNYKTIENSITSNVDNAYLVDDGVYMDGWAFITDNDTDNYKIGVIVNNDIYLANKVIRQDVKDYYSLKNAKVGFSIILDNNENFEICIVDQKNKIIYK